MWPVEVSTVSPWRAEVGPALDHPSRDVGARLATAVALLRRGDSRVWGTQQGRATSSGWRAVKWSHVHSQTLPAVSAARARWAGLRVRMVGRVGRSLGAGAVAGGLDEAPEVTDCHRVLVHPQAVDGDAVDRPLLGIEVLRAHQERPARYPRPCPLPGWSGRSSGRCPPLLAPGQARRRLHIVRMARPCCRTVRGPVAVRQDPVRSLDRFESTRVVRSRNAPVGRSNSRPSSPRRGRQRRLLRSEAGLHGAPPGERVRHCRPRCRAATSDAGERRDVARALQPGAAARGVRGRVVPCRHGQLPHSRGSRG